MARSSHASYHLMAVRENNPYHGVKALLPSQASIPATLPPCSLALQLHKYSDSSWDTPNYGDPRTFARLALCVSSTFTPHHLYRKDSLMSLYRKVLLPSSNYSPSYPPSPLSLALGAFSVEFASKHILSKSFLYFSHFKIRIK